MRQLDQQQSMAASLVMQITRTDLLIKSDGDQEQVSQSANQIITVAEQFGVVQLTTGDMYAFLYEQVKIGEQALQDLVALNVAANGIVLNVDTTTRGPS